MKNILIKGLFVSASILLVTSSASAMTCTNLTRALSKGSENSEVLKLQQFLVDGGYLTAKPIGYFGAGTVTAVKKFQGTNGLSQAGSVGTATRNKIKDISCGNITTQVRPTSNAVVTGGIEFNKLFEISSKKEAVPRGYIDSSISGENFWVTGDKLAYIVTYFNQDKTSRELRYDGKVVPVDSIRPSEDEKNGSKVGNLELNNKPIFATTTRTGEMVVMNGDLVVSKKYSYIIDLKVIGGKIAFLGRKESANGSSQHTYFYVLVWDNKEYGTQYDSVTGYIESAGIPAYVAVNYPRDNGNIDKFNGQYYLVKRDNVLFVSKKGEEMIWQVRELTDVNGNPAVIIRKPKTDSLYVYYKGKKLFEGYDINYVRNLDGKLAVLVGKDNSQYVFIEKNKQNIEYVTTFPSKVETKEDIRNEQRRKDVTKILDAITSYSQDNNKIPSTILDNPTEICASNSSSCKNLTDLSVLAPYIPNNTMIIPIDPNNTDTGKTGYVISKKPNGQLVISSKYSENGVIITVTR